MYQAFRKSKEKEAEYIREIARLKMDNDTLRSEAKKTDAAINELEEKLRTATKQVSDSKYELDKAHNRLCENASTIGKPEPTSRIPRPSLQTSFLIFARCCYPLTGTSTPLWKRREHLSGSAKSWRRSPHGPEIFPLRGYVNGSSG